jgi:hypothetical protein
MTIVVTTKDKLRCVQRELAMRKRCYPRWVDENKMSEGKKELELTVMEAIVHDYVAALAAEEAKERLI